MTKEVFTAHHGDDGLDGLCGDLLPTGPVHQHRAQVLEKEADPIADRLLVAQPVLAQL